MDEDPAKVKDPVCGRTIPKTTRWTEWYSTTEYHFCSERCRDTFRARPADFIPQTG